jgi:hypothetical protein
MKSPNQWQPDNFVIGDGHLHESRDGREVSAGSRQAADLVANAYERLVESHARGRLVGLGYGKVPLYAASVGLHVMVLERLGGAPEVLAEIAAKTLSHLPAIGARMADSIQRCAGLFARASIGRKLSAATTEQLPLGYFLVAQKRP